MTCPWIFVNTLMISSWLSIWFPLLLICVFNWRASQHHTALSPLRPSSALDHIALQTHHITHTYYPHRLKSVHKKYVCVYSVYNLVTRRVFQPSILNVYHGIVDYACIPLFRTHNMLRSRAVPYIWANLQLHEAIVLR